MEKIRYVCWDCEEEWKEGQVRRYVPSIDIPNSTDDICNKCYSKRMEKKLIDSRIQEGNGH